MTTALPAAHVLSESRQARMTEELVHALRHIPREQLNSWGRDSAVLFGKVTWRRAKNFGRLVGRICKGTASEVADGYNAHRSGGLADHAKSRVSAARESISSAGTAIATSAKTIQQALQSNPRDNAPALVVSTLAFLVASGGLDGDGGVPDLDLIAGIDTHRSIFTHSIISGAAIETFLLSSASFVSIAHSFLPERHDPIWDSIAKHKDRYVLATSQGASLGIAYHLFVDSTVDIGAYHDLPVSLPIGGHEAIAGANAAAEAIDVKHKDPKRHG